LPDDVRLAERIVEETPHVVDAAPVFFKQNL